MAIRIERNQKGNCINFHGSSNPTYFNACLSGEVDSLDNIAINVINDIITAQSGTKQYEFFRIPFTEFVDASGNAFADAQGVADYITLNANVSAPTDINVGYKGVYDASLSVNPSYGSPENGDWYYIGTGGTITEGSGVTATTTVYKQNDIIKYSDSITTWEKIENKNATVQELEDSALDRYDIHVDGDYTGTIRNGSSLYPYNDLNVAISASSEGNFILIKGVVEVPNSSTDAFTLPHSLYFYGTDNCEIRYASYNSANGNVFYFEGTDNSQSFSFRNIIIKNAGKYGFQIKKTSKVTIEDCTLKNNGWNGLTINTVLSSSVSGLLGYDSTNTELQAFYSGVTSSNGGATRIEEATQLLIVGNTVTNNLRGIRVSDCGIGGAGVISRNQSTQNIESGIYLSVGASGGCQNITVMMNVSSYNANNGLLVIGGINNKFSQNEVNGNWNAGFCSWVAANSTLRDCGLYDNNRSQYNGIGNTGDAKASIQINEAYNLLGTQITLNPAFSFIAEILDTQVHYTGLGSNTEKIGFLITEAVGLLDANDKNIIKVDDVGFVGQDYAIDFSEVNLTNLKVALGDNSYMNIGEKTVRQSASGEYFELPFSNHVTNINYADFSVDNTGRICIKEGPTGVKLNPYKVNDLQAIAHGAEIRIMLKGSNMVQFEVPVAGCSIDGVAVNSVLNQALIQLNGVFTNTVGFASNPDVFVDGFTLSGDDLTLTLNDGVSYTVDVTSLGVDENNFVASGALSGSDLILTMDDATTVTVDASGLAVDTDTTVSFGTIVGNVMTLSLSDASTVTIDVTSLALDTDDYVVSGALNADGINIDLTMDSAGVIQVPVGALAIDNNTTITSGVVSGTDIVLNLSDASIIIIDATTLATGSSTNVVSGSVVGTNLILVMSDASEITIDAANMVNGASLSATNDRWYISYGTNANQEVGVTTMTSAVNLQGPYYFGQTLLRGSEFKFNMKTGNQLRLGIWDGAEEATAYNGSPSMADASNWNTVFSYANGTGKFTDSSNVDVSTYHVSGYSATNNAAMSIRFGDDGHLSLYDISGATEVLVAKTTIALSATEFNMQFGGFNNSEFPNGIISTQDWTIVHDFAGTEAGIVNGILNHTVLKSNISIVAGEKIMFMLDEVGQGDFFGTDYTNASTGVGTAEDQLSNTFIYQTNEAIVFDTAFNVSDWDANTGATDSNGGYFYSANLNQYRYGGNAGTIQGMFSLRFNVDGTLSLYDEDADYTVATCKSDPTIGSQVSLYFGVTGNRAYYSIPVISKQTIGQGSQPDVNFAPTVADQTATVNEGGVLNFQVVTSGNLVNQIVELDAPSWMSMNQLTGVLSGTAPAFAGTSADTIVVNCKAGNAIGGTVEFTVTVTVASYASTNTKSLKFPSSSNAYLNGSATNVPSLARAANGAGAGDAWSVSMWVKPSTVTNAQTLFYYGGDDLTNEGSITLTQFIGNNLLLKYGNSTDNLNFIGVGNFPTNQWNHVLFTYNGADTITANGGATAFTMTVNGANAISQIQSNGVGYSGSIVSDRFRVGRYDGATTSQYLSNGIINQVAIWGTDESANKATIYNSGATQDLSQLASAPVHYYEVDSSITTIADVGTVANAPLTGFNFAAADLVTDAP